MCPPSSKLRGKGLGTNMEFSRASSGFFLLQLGINIFSVFTYNRQLMYSKEPFGLAEH